MRCCLIDENNIVINIIVLNEPLPDTFNNYKVIHELGNIGWTYNPETKTFITNTPTLTLEESREEKFEELASTLEQHEYGGVTYNGNRFATDKDSQIKYLGILVSAITDPNYTVQFKTLDKSYVELNALEVNQLCMTVKNHIQNCFNNDARLTELIKSATTVEELNNIDLDSGWPE